MSIKNIVFDIGNVLASIRFGEHMLEIGMPDEGIAAISDKWIHDPLWAELDRGVIPEEEIVAEAKRRLPEQAALIDEFWSHPEGLVVNRPQSAPWLAGLKARGYGVYLLSNYARSLFEAHAKGFTFLAEADGRIVSYEVGLLKPQPEIYELLFERFSLKAEECVFIDDMPDNVAAARKLGMAGIQYVDYQQASAELEAILAR